MEQVNLNSQLSVHILDMLNNGSKKDQTIDELVKEGHEEYFARQMVEQTIKLRNSKLMADGLRLILIGAAICLLSCIFALTSTGNFHLVMYGMTTLGILIIFAGLVKIF
jgi:hypothetical protein